MNTSENSLRSCYDRLAGIGLELESFQIIQAVAEHREYWRPSVTNVLLLAESHVWTTEQDFKLNVDVRRFGLANYPKKYIRLVYNLGYGEDVLLSESPSKNSGTPQYWKMFSSCCVPPDSDTSCEAILKTRNPNSGDRIGAKVDLLHEMKRRGIWLIDASIVALYRPGDPKPTPQQMHEAITLSWDEYLQNIVKEIQPKHVICIGSHVFSILRRAGCEYSEEA